MSVSDALKEAAMIDGCTPSQAMRNVTIPLMRSSFVQCIFLSITRCFVVYDVNLSLTKGEPFNGYELAKDYVFRCEEAEAKAKAKAEAKAEKKG